MTQKALNSPKILKVKLSSTSHSQVLGLVSSSLKRQRPLLITTPNPEIIVQAQSNPRLLAALNQANLALPDGIGLILASKLLGLPKLTRLRGREVMLALFRLAHDQELKIFLLGSTPKINRQAITKVAQEHPHLTVRGTSGPALNQQAAPVTKRDIALHKDTLDKINQYSPDILFVAFGAPKQELWLHQHLPDLNVKVAMTVGGSLDYYVGAQPLPPKFLASLGLEWFWRLIHQPRRLPRILTATLIFPLLVLKQKLTKSDDPQNS